MSSTVSVIIPTFNRAGLVAEAIESVLTQTIPPDEVIVVDDGSIDNTKSVIEGFGSRVNYFYQDNSGPSAARNRGIDAAKGDYVAFMDSDDLWPAHKNAMQVAFLEQNSGVDFVFADMANFVNSAESGDEGAEIKHPEIHDYLVSHGHDLDKFFSCLLIENVVPTPTVMCRRAALQKIGGFNEKFMMAEDLDLWLRAANVCRWGFINEVLLRRRRHATNLVGDPVRRNRALIEVLTSNATLQSATLPENQRIIERKLSDIRYDLGSMLFKQREYREARFHLSRVRNACGIRKAKLALKLLITTLIGGRADADADV